MICFGFLGGEAKSQNQSNAEETAFDIESSADTIPNERTVRPTLLLKVTRVKVVKSISTTYMPM